MKFHPALEQLHLLQHPFYRDWMEGKLTRSCLQDYARQYFHHVDAFPRYLGAIHSLGHDAAQRRVVLENLNDEEGFTHGKPHPELWLQFAEGLGALGGALPRSAITNVVDTFFRFAVGFAARDLVLHRAQGMKHLDHWRALARLQFARDPAG
ncbi:MAG: thiaminase II/PqqC family protein [Bdellovibrionota bacterium]